MDILLRDTRVSELFAQDRLERESTLALFRTIVTQLQDIAETCISIQVAKRRAGQASDVS